ncbi:hypothetical protein NMU03_09395 [Allocoprobacillus halotolerans]|uniref:Uncharacterized protein n=1 Tax=Allocoprobacillus halotolerans TaxID=2944914 RepID=A0ABY5HXZ5_9FIRM|nr:hypothetical protein [Allocoprobacillus halotolerans]UTY37929.1 hypothetical protein NMU03_09395 [Allocoprobacillus halotolerans]
MEKLFFFDIDGTLIECNKGIYSIPQDVRDGLRSLQKKDMMFFSDRKM